MAKMRIKCPEHGGEVVVRGEQVVTDRDKHRYFFQCPVCKDAFKRPRSVAKLATVNILDMLEKGGAQEQLLIIRDFVHELNSLPNPNASPFES